MSNQTTKTLNSYPSGKVQLRIEAVNKIDKPEIKVLDCFHGHGFLWTEVIKKSDKKISVLGIEKDITKKSKLKVIYGDNEKILPSLKLTEYDIIDLDAFGDSFHLIEQIINKIKPGTAVIYTQISVHMGGIHHSIIKKTIGIQIYSRCRSMLKKKCVDLFEASLYIIGIRKVYQFNHGSKIYGYFIKS